MRSYNAIRYVPKKVKETYIIGATGILATSTKGNGLIVGESECKGRRSKDGKGNKDGGELGAC